MQLIHLNQGMNVELKPVTNSYYPRQVAPHIWEISKAEYSFIDETDNYYEITYATLAAAQAALKMYGDEL